MHTLFALHNHFRLKLALRSLVLAVGLTVAACSDTTPVAGTESPATSGSGEGSTHPSGDNDGALPGKPGAADAGRSTAPGSPRDAQLGMPNDSAIVAPPTSAGDAGAAPTDVGSGDGKTGKAPFVATGAPLVAPDRVWTWFEFPNTKCRDGSPAGIAVSMSAASKNLMLFLEAGGACFDATTCLVNPSSIGNHGPAGSAGIFDRSNADNPVKDWSFVYVPYCTGDTHLGSNDAAQIEGVSGTQHLVGRLNMMAFLDRVVPTFVDPPQVLVTGTSAGGFAASASVELVQWAFGPTPKFSMIDDSGPPMSQGFLPKCLIDLWKKTWLLDKGIGADCGTDCTANGDFEMEYLAHIQNNSDLSFGILESDSDAIIRGFYGIGTNNGANDCKGTLLVTPMDPTVFRNGLLDVRMRVKDDPRFSSYYPASEQHTWLESNDFYSAPSGGTRIVDWFKNVLDGKPGTHVGP